MLTVDRKRGLMYLLVTIYYSVQQVITEAAVLKRNTPKGRMDQ